jgi:hypothetical protein
MIFLNLFLTVFLAVGLYFLTRMVSVFYPIYGTLSQVTFYAVTVLYFWHLLKRGRR